MLVKKFFTDFTEKYRLIIEMMVNLVVRNITYSPPCR